METESIYLTECPECNSPLEKPEGAHLKDVCPVMGGPLVFRPDLDRYGHPQRDNPEDGQKFSIFFDGVGKTGKALLIPGGAMAADLVNRVYDFTEKLLIKVDSGEVNLKDPSQGFV